MKTIHDLPFEMIHKIFLQLDIIDRFNLICASKHIMDLSYNVPIFFMDVALILSRLYKRDLNHLKYGQVCFSEVNDILKRIKKFPGIKYVNLNTGLKQGSGLVKKLNKLDMVLHHMIKDKYKFRVQAIEFDYMYGGLKSEYSLDAYENLRHLVIDVTNKQYDEYGHALGDGDQYPEFSNQSFFGQEIWSKLETFVYKTDDLYYYQDKFLKLCRNLKYLHLEYKSPKSNSYALDCDNLLFDIIIGNKSLKYLNIPVNFTKTMFNELLSQLPNLEFLKCGMVEDDNSTNDCISNIKHLNIKGGDVLKSVPKLRTFEATTMKDVNFRDIVSMSCLTQVNMRLPIVILPHITGFGKPFLNKENLFDVFGNLDGLYERFERMEYVEFDVDPGPMLLYYNHIDTSNSDQVQNYILRSMAHYVNNNNRLKSFRLNMRSFHRVYKCHNKWYDFNNHPLITLDFAKYRLCEVIYYTGSDYESIIKTEYDDHKKYIKNQIK